VKNECGQGGIPTSIGIMIMLLTALLTVFVLGGVVGVAGGQGFVEGGSWYVQHMTDPVTVPVNQWYIVTGERPDGNRGGGIFDRPPDNWNVNK
jgi:hypothetical protein